MIKAIQPYIDNEEFQPAAIAKVSKACTSICQWVRAMHKYHFVAKAVEPKRVRAGYIWRAGEGGRTPQGTQQAAPMPCGCSKPCGRPRTTWR